MNRFSFLLVLICTLFLTACGGEGGEATTPETEASSENIIKVEPQSFPVNDLPDAWFGKSIAETAESMQLADANLTEIQDSYPSWLDAIISRESIVAFAGQVLTEMPDELEFVQSSQKHYDGPDGWKVFKVLFSTRPSNANIFVYGAYLNEDKSFWVSELSKEPIGMQLMHAVPVGEGVVVQGLRADAPFVMRLEKEAVTQMNSGS